jgi:hypothetical protein
VCPTPLRRGSGGPFGGLLHRLGNNSQNLSHDYAAFLVFELDGSGEQVGQLPQPWLPPNS